MPNPPPSSATAQPDSDAQFRHTPGAAEPGPPDKGASRQGPGVSASGWTDPGASATLKGEAGAGGADPRHPHLFHLAGAPADLFDGGGLQGAHGDNWPLLQGQQGAIYLARLAPGGVREPHWHPSAWEINFVIQGRVRWSFVGPNSTHDSFEAAKGDVVFAPQGHLHYFENASDTDDLIVLIVFNSSAKEPDDDIGIVQSLKAMPPDVLAAVFGASPETFATLPGKFGRVVIASKARK